MGRGSSDGSYTTTLVAFGRLGSGPFNSKISVLKRSGLSLAFRDLVWTGGSRTVARPVLENGMEKRQEGHVGGILQY
jgi:hypothetical protein